MNALAKSQRDEDDGVHLCRDSVVAIGRLPDIYRFNAAAGSGNYRGIRAFGRIGSTAHVALRLADRGLR
jgi:hypothetical protein